LTFNLILFFILQYLLDLVLVIAEVSLHYVVADELNSCVVVVDHKQTRLNAIWRQGIVITVFLLIFESVNLYPISFVFC
jgi:hypothetical protein